MRSTVRTLHRRMGLTVGVVLLVWLVTGIVMLVPMRWLRPSTHDLVVAPTSGPDFRDVRVSVPQAIAVLEVDRGLDVRVRGVEMKRLGRRLLYEIVLEGGHRELVDTVDGNRLTIGTTTAEDLARRAAPGSGAILSMERLHRGDDARPAYRFSFADGWGTVVTVSPTGRVESSTSISRVVGLLGAVHTFAPVRAISQRLEFQVGLLALCAVAGIAAVGSGFCLALLAPLRRRHRARLARPDDGAALELAP